MKVALRFFRRMLKNRSINLKLARERINDIEYYENFSVLHISRYIDLNKENISIKTSEKQKELIGKVVYRFIDDDEINANNILNIVSLIVFYDFELSNEQIIKILPYSYYYSILTTHINAK